MPGGVGGVASRGVPLSRSTQEIRIFQKILVSLGEQWRFIGDEFDTGPNYMDGAVRRADAVDAYEKISITPPLGEQI